MFQRQLSHDNAPSRCSFRWFRCDKGTSSRNMWKLRYHFHKRCHETPIFKLPDIILIPLTLFCESPRHFNRSFFVIFDLEGARILFPLRSVDFLWQFYSHRVISWQFPDFLDSSFIHWNHRSSLIPRSCSNSVSRLTVKPSYKNRVNKNKSRCFQLLVTFPPMFPQLINYIHNRF